MNQDTQRQHRAETFNRLVEIVATMAIDGIGIEDTVTDPNGPCAPYVLEFDLDAIADAAGLAYTARFLNLTGYGVVRKIKAS